MSDRIYPVPVKPPSGITGWDGWPEDVKEILWDWNHGPGTSRLRFPYTSGNVFKCPDCEEFCRPSGGPTPAELDGVLICDECLVARAREALREQG